MSLTKYSFDIFLGMILLSLMKRSDMSYVFLFIILIIYLYKKYDYKEVIWILALLFIISFWIFRQPSFKENLKGEVKALLSNGIQVENILIKTDVNQYEIGDIIEATLIQNDFPTSSQDGGFDEKYYLISKGIDYVAYPSSICVIRQRFHLRNAALDFVEENADERLKDIYLYLLLGYKTDEMTSLSQIAKEMAILHLFAISGMHFVVLSEFLKKILTFFMNEKKADRMILGVMTIYAICLEGNVAAWRAYLVLLLKHLGLDNPISRFGLIGVMMLLCNSGLVCHMGFIYSMSLYFLVLMTKELKKNTLFVYIGSMVISMYFQYEIIPLGYLFGLLFNQIISTLFPVFVLDLCFQSSLSDFCFLLYEGMDYVMKVACQYSFSWTIGQPPEYLIIAFYISYIYAIYHWDIYRIKYYFLIPCTIFTICILYPYIDYYGEVVMVDVGQGDCFLISFPFNQENILIDTGGLSYTDVATKTVIPLLKYKGIQKLDAVYLSHQDFDHCGGLESLKENFKVEEIIEDFSENIHQNSVFKQLNHKVYDNENDNSLVIYVTLGDVSYLFTGDVSVDVEKDLIKRYPDLDIDVLKVGHHGSKTSSSNELLQTITPKLSLISVGKNNRYGHPSIIVLNRLKAYGSFILRTDQMGSQMIYFTEKHSYIEKPN